MTKLFIGPYETGLQKNLEPWLLPNEAFTEIEDAYVFRGRIKKKNGYQFLQRLHLTPTLPEVKIPVAAGVITYTDTLTNFPVSPGTITINITYGGGFVFTDNGNGTLTATTLPAGITWGWGTINYLTGVFVLNWDAALAGPGPYIVAVTQYRYLPIVLAQRLPVMGLCKYERPLINREDLIAFDTDFSYLYNSATGFFDVLADAAGNRNLWTGSNSNFFWTTNYYKQNDVNYLFWATNGIYNTNAIGWVQDGIMIYNGINWFSQTPQIDAIPTYLRGCLLLVPYRNRMVALNTWEGPNVGGGNPAQFQFRARWTQNGNPVYDSVTNPDAWRSDIAGHGGYIDAPTNEAIVSARFYKDTLVVFFESSTWELRYTGNEILPFVWYKINTELGCESTFSTVQFDNGIYAIGDKAIILANSAQVIPIDAKIPDVVFEIENENEGIARVHGIRDFFRRMVYWTYPSAERDGVFPDKVLTINYEQQTYSFFNDTFTCFGYYQRSTDYTWADITWTWNEWTLPWNSAKTQAWFPDIIAGNQDGNVVILDQKSNNDPAIDLLRNALAGTVAITAANPAVFFSPNHNLYGSFASGGTYYNGDYVKPFYISGFAIPVVNEAVGTALTGTTQFTGSFGGLIIPWCGYIITSAIITIGGLNFIDLGNHVLIDTTGANVGTISYENRTISINYPILVADTPVTISYSYNIINYRTFVVQSISANTFSLLSINDNGTFSPLNLAGYANYDDWAEIAVLNNFYITTKTLYPFVQEALGTRLNYLDLYFSNASGTLTLNFFVDESTSQIAQNLQIPMFKDTIANVPINTEDSVKFWKRAFTNLTANEVQLSIQFSSVQMRNSANYNSLFEFHAMILDVSPTGRLIGYS